MSSSDEDCSSDNIERNDATTGFGDQRRRRRNRDDELYGVFLEDMENAPPVHRHPPSKNKTAGPVSFVPSASNAPPARATVGDGSDTPAAPAAASVAAEAQSRTPSVIVSPPPLHGTSKGRPGYSSFGGHIGAQKVEKNFAKFEQHTKGIGSKLMAKMGWAVGQGLGHQKQGIVRPIEVKVRAKGQALQNEGERTEQSRSDFPVEKSLEVCKDKHIDILCMCCSLILSLMVANGV